MERNYKDSGTKGIGLIPQSWDSRQLGIFFSENKKANSNLESVTALQFKYGEIIQKPNNGRDLSDKDKELLSKYTVIEPGDVIVNGLNLNFDLKSLRIAIARENGIITSAYIVLKPRKGVNPNYYNYVLKALDFQKILHGMGEGIRLTLSYDELKKLNVPAPAASIQSVIVDYLDKKCVEIDSLISLQEQMIEKLKAYKQSVITEAVTKGLDPNAKLVPSGIDWIGEIPQGWKVCRIKNISSINTNSLAESTQSDFEFDYVDIGSVSFEQGIYKSEHYIFKDAPSRARKKANLGDIVMSTVRTYLRAIDVVDTVEKSQYIYSTGFAIITPRANVLSSFLSFITKSDCFLKQVIIYSKGINYPSINTNELIAISVALPPIIEQTIIAEYLSKKCKEIDMLVSIKQQKIEKLKDYKKSVIYEAVTGKTIIEQ